MMSEGRIRRPSAMADVLELLKFDEASNRNGIFDTYADALVFAASLGARRGERLAFEQSDEPIRWSVFENKGYDTVVSLLALATNGDPKVLADSDDAFAVRALIFEEFANGGLALLQEELRGSVDPADQLVLLLADERRAEGAAGSSIDISDLL